MRGAVVSAFRVHRGLPLVAALLLAGVAGGGVARACALDQKPSISVDGHLARLNTQVPATAAQLAAWAPFVTAQTFAVQRPVVLTEDRREVAQSLTAVAMRRPWRWQFGDGTTAYGWTVRHAWMRPGPWRVDVSAYDPGTRQWYPFDHVLLTVHR